jgi:pilus assembly protein CpaE
VVLAPDGTGAARDGRIVTVFSAKGGCGKTTVATNLAAALALGDRRVCLVDLDLEFGDVAIAMQLLPERTIVDLLPMVGSMDETGVASVLTPAAGGLEAVIAPVSPAQAGNVAPALVGELLRVLRRMYDFVVLDTPPAITEQVLTAFDSTDVFVLLATPDVPALKNLRVCLDTLDLLGYPKPSRLLALNRADSRVGLDVVDVERALLTRVAVQIPSSGDVPAAINRGQLIVRSQPTHAVSFAVHELAGLIVGGRSEPAPVERGGGLRSRLRRRGAR